MAVGFSNTNKPINPRGNDASPKAFNRAKLYSGKALSFDGVNDNIAFTDFEFTAGNKYSLCIYANRDNIGTIWSRNNQWIEINFVGSAVQLRTYDTGWNTYTLIDDVPANEWHQIVITYDVNANTWASYLNGQFVKSITAAEPDNKRINRIGSTASGFYDGEFANAKIFDVALTAAQVADLYNNPEKVVPTGVDNTALKLWLPMQEGAGTTAYDGSGNGNHGTISGATYVNGVGAPVSQTAVIDWNKGTNLFNHSEEFSNWTNTENTTLADNAATSPQGVQNAYSVTAGTNNNYHRIFNSITTTSGTSYTTSIFAKANGHNFILFRLQSIGGGNKNVSFNLSTGAVDFESTAVSDANVEPYGNGWYRCSITFTADVTSMSVYIRSQPATQVGVNDGINQYTGNGSDGIYIFGAQTAAGSLSPYVPTLATAQTSEVLLPQGLTTGRDITGVNLFENVRKQGALNLDGNSWAEVHDNASLDVTSAITLEAWVYWDGSVTSAKGLLGRWFAGGACYMFFTNNATQISFYINTSSTTFTISGTGWKHIVGTYDSIKRRVYVDGQEIGSGTAYTTAITTSSDPVEIGRYNGNTAYQYDGDIAQPRIYNRALTAAEVLQNYNSGKNTYK